jgi:hypothetical protein
MKKIGIDGDVKKIDYKLWPLFTNYRKKKEFVAAYKEIFKEELIIEETPLPFVSEVFLKELIKQPSKGI